MATLLLANNQRVSLASDPIDRIRNLQEPSPNTPKETQSTQVKISLVIESTPSEMNIKRQLLFETKIAKLFQTSFTLPSASIHHCYANILSQDWDSNVFEMDDRTSLVVELQMDMILTLEDEISSMAIEEYTNHFFDDRGYSLAIELSSVKDRFFKGVERISTPKSSIQSYYVEVDEVEEESESEESNSHIIAGWVVALGSLSAVFSTVTILYSR